MYGEPSGDPSADDVLIEEERAETIRAAMRDKCSEDVVETIGLYYGLDRRGPLTLNQISALTGIGRETARKRLVRGLMAMTKHKRFIELFGTDVCDNLVQKFETARKAG